MGEVFVARTPWEENPLAAVKRLRPDVARVPTFAERFEHEAQLAVRLEHDNVVGTLDVGSVEGQLYVASELVLGKDTGLVADRLRERGQGGPAAVAIRLLLDALAGLAYVHGVREPTGEPLKLVHRDVTPGNVLVGYDGVARLADFGLAKSLLTEKSNLTNHGEILGTPHYLAPEVIRGGPASPASDLYGLGAVMYRFLTGIAPHQGTTAEVLLKVLSEEPRPLSDLRPDLPPWLVVFVHRLLQKDPSHRPFDATLLHAQLHSDAKAAGLLVPKPAVGRWLGSLFEREKEEEVAEYERVAAISPDDVPEESEGTVVLARPRSGSKLEAPSPVDEMQIDAQGTELDLSEAEVRAAQMNRPVIRDVVPSDPDPYDDEPDGQPTKAVTVLKTGFESGSEPTKASDPPPDDLLDSDTQDSAPDEATKFGSFVPESGSSDLPGFVDEAKRGMAMDPGSTAPDPELSPPKRRRPNPESVVVSPVAAKAKPPEPRRGPTPGPRPDARSDPVAPATRAAPDRKRAAPSRKTAPSRPPSPKRKKPTVGRNILLLIGLLCLAVALGIGIGVLVASFKTPSARTVPLREEQSALRHRFLDLKREMEGRSSRGEPLPPLAWELMTDAGSNLMEGREAEARSKIEEAERLLRSQPGTARR